MPSAPAAEIGVFRAFDEPGHVKVAFNFSCKDGLVATETRVAGTDADARARRWFAAYWFVIRIGSGIIRRVWLRAIMKRAESRSIVGVTGTSSGRRAGPSAHVE